MFVQNINPTLLNIGRLEIRYYGIIYALGFIIAYFMINYLASRRKLDLTKDDVADFIFHLILGTVLGARLFFVLYNINYFITNPFEIIAVWHGGLIFFGGFIGSLIAAYLFSKKKKINLLKLADITVIPLALALALGRVGNFINSEFVGRISSLPWAVNFKNEVNSLGDLVFRHPVQLYNSFANLTIFVFLWAIKDKKFRQGTFLFTFLGLYSFQRFLFGFLKIEDQYGFILGLTIEQVIFLTTSIISLIFLIRLRGKKHEKTK